MPCKQGQCKTLDIIINDKLKKSIGLDMKILKRILIYFSVFVFALFVGYLVYVGVSM